MSDGVTIKCEFSNKHWKDYGATELRLYLLKNIKKTDCSFIVEGREDKQSIEEYRTFQWILCNMSPVLQEILNREENKKKNWKKIVVSHLEYIGAIVYYGHTKTVDTKIIRLVEFYEAAKLYEIKILEDEVIEMFESDENQKKTDWVKLFWLSYVKYPADERMRSVFEKVLKHVNWTEKYADANMDFILEFNEENFNTFFDIMVNRGVDIYTCFKITEAYLIKHLFDGDKERPPQKELGLIERDVIESYIDKIKLYNLRNCEPEAVFSSDLICKRRKIEILNRTRLTYYSKNWSPSLIDEYIKKLQAKEIYENSF